MKAGTLNTTLAEFTYTVARETPVSIRRRLPEKYFKAISTEKGAMRFANRSSLDQKREFFTYLGIDHYLVFIDSKKNSGMDFRETLRKFTVEEDPHKTLQQLVGSNVFISGSKEQAYLMGFLAQGMDTKQYVRDMELIRSSYHIKSYKKNIGIPEYTESVEGKEVAFRASKIISAVLWANDACESVIGIDGASLRLLLYFYLNRQSYFSDDNLKVAMAGGLSGRTVSASRKRLFANDYLSHHPIKSKPEYTITATGILLVNQFREKVIKSLDF